MGKIKLCMTVGGLKFLYPDQCGPQGITWNLSSKVPATHVARVWQELDYRIDICRLTKGGHIEHL